MGMKRDRTTINWFWSKVDSGSKHPPTGHPANPETHDLAGSNAEVTVTGPGQRVYHIRMESTSSGANLQGLTGSVAQHGTIAVVWGASGDPTNTVTVEDANGGATDPFNLKASQNLDITVQEDFVALMYDSGTSDWFELARSDDVAADVLLAGDGTAASPSLTFAANTDDGLANPTDGELLFSLGGSEVYSLVSSTESNDGMVADPETATEDAFFNVSIGSNTYQVPLYSG